MNKFETTDASITDLLGKTLKKIVIGYNAEFGDEIAFYTGDNEGYVMRNIQGHVNIRLVEEANGYYSEEVDFKKFYEKEGEL